MDSEVQTSRQLSKSIQVVWGESSMIAAKILLFGEALEDVANQRFVLRSDSCVPLHNFSYIYNYVMSSSRSFMDSFVDVKGDRYHPKMPSIIPKDKWRNGSKWIALVRRQAEVKNKPSLDALLSDICISTSAAPTFLPAHHFVNEFSHGKVREFNLFDGCLAANNPQCSRDKQLQSVEEQGYHERSWSSFLLQRHLYELRHVFINYGGKWGKMSSAGWVNSDYTGGKSFKYGVLCGEEINYELPFVVKNTDDLRDMWAQGDESYPMRTHFYNKPTDVVKEMLNEVGEYVLLDEDDIDYIISPRETKVKNTKDTPVKATPVKTNAKRKGKAMVMSPSKPSKAANKSAKKQKKKEKTIVLSEEGEDLDDLPEVYHSDKEIDTEEINDFEIETSVNIDYVPTTEDLERGNEFERVDVELDDIYRKEEDDKVKTPLPVGFKKLEVGMQWATVYEAREHMRRFGILNYFTYTCIKNESTKLMLKYSQEKCEWLVFISRYNYGHTMVLRHGSFQHSCEGNLGAQNTLYNIEWVAREVESLVRDVRAMTPKAIKARMKTKYGVEISYWTAWNTR
ncbi:hypothetical protein GIB67_031983 [Kingdonia uniflora]|uniref:Transposase n=1 Tax=Kingdonia uniflora TaxID=39325 RepID=A0A7J7MJY9_9MAGN|nr:hypothetical protein GIB67_031983 [Kingdonia uniflora]